MVVPGRKGSVKGSAALLAGAREKVAPWRATGPMLLCQGTAAAATLAARRTDAHIHRFIHLSLTHTSMYIHTHTQHSQDILTPSQSSALLHTHPSHTHSRTLTHSQEADDNRSKNAGGSSSSSSGGRRHHNSHGGARRQQHHDCNNNDIAECVELLEVLTNKDLGFAATVDELNKMCP